MKCSGGNLISFSSTALDAAEGYLLNSELPSKHPVTVEEED